MNEARTKSCTPSSFEHTYTPNLAACPQSDLNLEVSDLRHTSRSMLQCSRKISLGKGFLQEE